MSINTLTWDPSINNVIEIKPIDNRIELLQRTASPGYYRFCRNSTPEEISVTIADHPYLGEYEGSRNVSSFIVITYSNENQPSFIKRIFIDDNSIYLREIRTIDSTEYNDSTHEYETIQRTIDTGWQAVKPSQWEDWNTHKDNLFVKAKDSSSGVQLRFKDFENRVLTGLISRPSTSNNPFSIILYNTDGYYDRFNLPKKLSSDTVNRDYKLYNEKTLEIDAGQFGAGEDEGLTIPYYNPTGDGGAQSLEISINFNKTFSKAPIVVASIDSNSRASKTWVDRTLNITTTGFTAKVKTDNANGVPLGTSRILRWIAVGNT